MFIQDKINIYLQREVKEKLDSDNEMFEIFKSSAGTINRNQFLSLLICGYHETFEREKRELYEIILGELEHSPLKSDQKVQIATNIMERCLFPTSGKRYGKNGRPLSLKPTKQTETVLMIISNRIENDGYISRYLDGMFTSYAKKPFSERERIVFKDTYDTLAACCKARQPVCFSMTNNKSIIHEVVPYALATGQEELYNYLLGQEVNERTNQPEACAYRLNRIRGITLSGKTISLQTDVREKLDRMIKQGPQYAINDEAEVCVKLTENGRKMYKRIYFGRPAFDRDEERTDGYYQYYNCSHNQVELYFRRFGAEAEIICPAGLRDRIAEFHRQAARVYEET